jgi:hypothetical protein
LGSEVRAIEIGLCLRGNSKHSKDKHHRSDGQAKCGEETCVMQRGLRRFALHALPPSTDNSGALYTRGKVGRYRFGTSSALASACYKLGLF